MRRVLRIGHRGAAGHAPENTLAAIQKGIDLGVDFVEIDLRRTADGALVVLHDASVNRTTNGRGRVDRLS
ncbi:MAG: glycerophosphodiester phosphodiesterase, partial [Nitrospira sp.]|nr:glycerophosphodiester phosphodiesterase [Nitrospira sp.]